MLCERCKKEHDRSVLRVHWADSAFGVGPCVTCEVCHKKEIAAVRAEAKRFGFRLKTPPAWERLETLRQE